MLFACSFVDKFAIFNFYLEKTISFLVHLAFRQDSNIS